MDYSRKVAADMFQKVRKDHPEYFKKIYKKYKLKKEKEGKPSKKRSRRKNKRQRRDTSSSGDSSSTTSVTASSSSESESNSESNQESDSNERKKKGFSKNGGKGRKNKRAPTTTSVKIPVEDPATAGEVSSDLSDSDVECMPIKEVIAIDVKGVPALSGPPAAANKMPPKKSKDEQNVKNDTVEESPLMPGIAGPSKKNRNSKAEGKTEEREVEDEDDSISLHIAENETLHEEADPLTVRTESLLKFKPDHGTKEVRACSFYNSMSGCDKEWWENHVSSRARNQHRDRNLVILHCCHKCLFLTKQVALHSRLYRGCKYYNCKV